MPTDDLVLAMKFEALVKRDRVEVRVQTHGPHPRGLKACEGGFHQLLPDALSPQLRRDNDRAQEGEAIIGRGGEDPDHTSVAPRGEASLGRRQLALQGLRGLQAISRLRRVDWQSIPSEMRADETQEPCPEDHDRRNAETREEHDRADDAAYDRGQIHPSPRKKDAEGTSVDP